MAEIGKTTRVVNKASVNIMRALDRAKGSLADIPLGVVKHDPRTEKKRQEAQRSDPQFDTTMTRLLYEMRGKNLDPNQPDPGDLQQ